jgi:hypothetical protein
LLWNEDYADELARAADGQSKPKLMTLDDLLAQIRGLKAEHKLLLLDAGQLPADPRLGMFVNEFPRLVEERVKATGDGSLLVLTSHGPLERSHVYASDRQTVFAHYIAEGMKGEMRASSAADMTLAEFIAFVQDNVRKRRGRQADGPLANAAARSRRPRSDRGKQSAGRAAFAS